MALREDARRPRRSGGGVVAAQIRHDRQMTAAAIPPRTNGRPHFPAVGRRVERFESVDPRRRQNQRRRTMHAVNELRGNTNSGLGRYALRRDVAGGRGSRRRNDPFAWGVPSLPSRDSERA